jgi:hypothetical protein
MADRLRAIDAGARDYQQALPQFLNQSPWDDRPSATAWPAAGSRPRAPAAP